MSSPALPPANNTAPPPATLTPLPTKTTSPSPKPDPPTTAPPPITSSTLPAVPIAPAPSTPGTPPPTTTPSTPPPAITQSTPPPKTTPSTPPPTTTPSTPPPTTTPSTPPPTTTPSTPPPTGTPSTPPPTITPSTPPPSTTPSTPPPTITPSTPPPSTTPSTPPPTIAPSTPPPTITPSTPPPSTTSTTPPHSTTPSTPPHSTTPSTPPHSTTPLTPPSTIPSVSPVPPSPPAPKGGSSPSTPPDTGGSSGSGASPPSPTDSADSGISTSVVVGIAVGGVALLVILSLMFICFKKKKRRAEPVPQPPPTYKADPYAVQSWKHNATPPAYQAVAVAPQPSLPPSHSPVQAPSPQPPPPLLYMSSSGGSGSNSSGPVAPLPPTSSSMSLGNSKSAFTYEELAMATDGFSEANLLGQGGFGYVHRGVLPSGKEVAVKQLKAGSGQGEREFQAEVEIISRVHHKHLVSLVGYCITGVQRMLVYEFVTNNTLEFHLHGKGRPVMDWGSRMKIALGSAKGLAYLHEDCHPKIIHRDIKASNILLNYNFEAKVADFGLAKFTSDANTHVSTRVMGTFGYLAPEYAASGKLSEKSDVFSFGVMLLELITGRRPVDTNQYYMADSLVDWARPLLTRALEDGNFDTFVDRRLGTDYNQNEMARMVASAAACIRHSAKRRPRMSQVVRAFEGDVSLSDLNEGMRPGHSNVYSSNGSSDYDTNQYNEDMKKFRKMALGTQEYGSSDQYSNPTSEYGLNPSVSSSEGQLTREMSTGKVKKDSRGFSSGV